MVGSGKLVAVSSSKVCYMHYLQVSISPTTQPTNTFVTLNRCHLNCATWRFESHTRVYFSNLGEAKCDTGTMCVQKVLPSGFSYFWTSYLTYKYHNGINLLKIVYFPNCQTILLSIVMKITCTVYNYLFFCRCLFVCMASL